ncbi:hypothetical protein Tco_0005962 [Tanacetum coccineum]
MIPNPDNDEEEIIEPLSKMTKGNKKNTLLMLMFGSDVTSYVRHSRLMDEFDKFAAKEGESLESVYKRLTTLVIIMDRNSVRPIPVSINTKFLNCLQPEWSKYVTMVRHNQTGDTVSYDVLAITQKFSTPTNNRLLTSSNTRNQAVIQDGRVDIQTKNADYGRNGNMNAGRENRNQAFNTGNRNDESNEIVHRVPQTESTPRKTNVQCYNYNEKCHYARDCQKLRVRDAK